MHLRQFPQGSTLVDIKEVEVRVNKLEEGQGLEQEYPRLTGAGKFCGGR